MIKGGIKLGDSMYNTRSGKTVKISRLVKLHSDELQDVNEVFAGDIFATFGIDCATGDTFTSKYCYQILVCIL